MWKMITAFFCAIIAPALGYSSYPERHAISYEYCGGRFGDKILGYSHARYLSYITRIPFLSRSSSNRDYLISDQLMIDYESFPFQEKSRQYIQVFPIKSSETLAEFFRMLQDPGTPPTLFMVDYFPSDISEWDLDSSWTTTLVIPWKEEGFANYLRNSLQPRIPIPDFTMKGRLNVADHMRDLSGADTDDPSRRLFPLKHPNMEYHERQIRRVYEWNGIESRCMSLYSAIPKRPCNSWSRSKVGFL